MPAFVNLTGQKFGRLTVLARAENQMNHTRWLCRCDCGNESVVRSQALRDGTTQSCGCYNIEQKIEICRSRATHGNASRGNRTKTYATWVNMLSRCRNPRATAYPKYGARGIAVCQRWLSYENFLADMGEQPPGLTIDRIDPRGNYEPGNCRWLDMRGQQNNRTNNRLIECFGERLTLPEWSRRTGVQRSTISHRIRLGWPVEQALSLPPSPLKRNIR